MTEAQLVEVVMDAAEAGSWNAAAWILERRYPERWLKLTARPQAPEPQEHDRFEAVIQLAEARKR